MDILFRIAAVPLAAVLVIGLLFGGLYIAAQLGSLFSKRLNDPDLGELRYFWGVWTGQAGGSVFQNAACYLPGSRKAPDVAAKKLVQKVNAEWPQIENAFLDAFASEIASEGAPEVYEHVEEAARSLDAARLKKFSWLSEISVEADKKTGQMRIWLGFLHQWDPEHTRSLVLNQNLKVEDYGLTCAL